MKCEKLSVVLILGFTEGHKRYKLSDLSRSGFYDFDKFPKLSSYQRKTCEQEYEDLFSPTTSFHE